MTLEHFPIGHPRPRFRIRFSCDLHISIFGYYVHFTI